MTTELIIHLHDRSVVSELRTGSPPSRKQRELPDRSMSLTATQLCAAVMDTGIASVRPKPKAVALVMPSSWCYVHRVHVPQRRPARPTLAYALEEFLPCDVEQLTCEFIRAGNGQHIGVAVETCRFRPLLDALEDAGVSVEHVTIDVLHAAEGVRHNGILVWCDSEHVTLLARADRGISDLRVLRIATGISQGQRLQRIAQYAKEVDSRGGGGDILVAGCVDAADLCHVADLLRGRVITERANIARRETCFNLAQDAPSSRRAAVNLLKVVRRTAVAVLVALLLMAGTLYMQRNRLLGQRQQLAGWEQRVFTELFPGQGVPAGVALRLASERKRLEGLTLAGQPTETPPSSALEVLRTIIAALPNGVQLDIQEIRIEGSVITVRGRTRDHAHAERLVASLDKLDLLTCAPPRTDRLKEGGVQFFVSAQRKSAQVSAGAAMP